MEPLYSLDYKGFRIEVHRDDDPQNPRTEWDNAATMACFHRRYALGDKDPGYRSEDYSDWDAMEADIVRREKPVCIFPLWLYDHSGLRLKIGSFQGLLPQGHAEFDSGQVGFIWVSRRNLDRFLGFKRLGAKAKEAAERCCRQEVSVYDDYLRGACYGVVVVDPRRDGEPVDSLWGIYLSDNETLENNFAIEEAKGRIDELAPEYREQTCLELSHG